MKNTVTMDWEFFIDKYILLLLSSTKIIIFEIIYTVKKLHVSSTSG